MAPAPYHMPIETVSVRVRAPALGENAFWGRILDLQIDRDTAGIVKE